MVFLAADFGAGDSNVPAVLLLRCIQIGAYKACLFVRSGSWHLGMAKFRLAEFRLAEFTLALSKKIQHQLPLIL